MEQLLHLLFSQRCEPDHELIQGDVRLASVARRHQGAWELAVTGSEGRFGVAPGLGPVVVDGDALSSRGSPDDGSHVGPAVSGVGLHLEFVRRILGVQLIPETNERQFEKAAREGGLEVQKPVQA